MSAFHDVLFPLSLSLGSVGGPERRTEIVTRMSGHEERNSPWADSRRRWDVGPAMKSRADLEQLIAFFEARKARLHGFRFRDPLDHSSASAGQSPQMDDQRLGLGTGNQRRFALTKAYVSGPSHWSRPILKPVLESLRVAVDGSEVPADFDPVEGEVVLEAPAPAGSLVTAGYLFDCPVRFETDRLDIGLDHVGAGSLVIPLIEIRI